jgi:hypothetical protein
MQKQTVKYAVPSEKTTPALDGGNNGRMHPQGPGLFSEDGRILYQQTFNMTQSEVVPASRLVVIDANALGAAVDNVAAAAKAALRDLVASAQPVPAPETPATTPPAPEPAPREPEPAPPAAVEALSANPPSEPSTCIARDMQQALTAREVTNCVQVVSVYVALLRCDWRFMSNRAHHCQFHTDMTAVFQRFGEKLAEVTSLSNYLYVGEIPKQIRISPTTCLLLSHILHRSDCTQAGSFLRALFQEQYPEDTVSEFRTAMAQHFAGLFAAMAATTPSSKAVKKYKWAAPKLRAFVGQVILAWNLERAGRPFDAQAAQYTPERGSYLPLPQGLTSFLPAGL